jgi:hypothetical protein
MADTTLAALKRHRAELIKLRTVSRNARTPDKESAVPKGSAMVGHIRIEREICTELLKVDIAVATMATRDLVGRLRAHEALALATSSMAAAQNATQELATLEANDRKVAETLTDMLAQAPTDLKRALKRQLDKDLESAG